MSARLESAMLTSIANNWFKTSVPGNSREKSIFTYSGSSGGFDNAKNTQLTRIVRRINNSKNLQLIKDNTNQLCDRYAYIKQI